MENTTTKTLRYYQEEAKNNIYRDWAHGINRALIGMATGTGKTYTFCKVIEGVWEPGNKAVVIVHQDSLMHQAHALFSQEFNHNVSLGKVQGTKHKDYKADIIFAMVQSLNDTRLKKIGKVDYVVIDETHHYTSENKWGKAPLWFLEKNPDAKMLGCTATWYRTDGVSMGTMFPEVAERNELTYHYGILQAIRDGYLSKFDAYIIEAQVDISGFSNSKGFIGTEQEWDKLWRTSNWSELLYDEWANIGGIDKQTMAFMPSVNISKAFCRWLGQERGIVAGHVDGEQSLIFDGDTNDLKAISRDDLVEKFRNSEFSYLSNFGVFTEGTDFPNLEILIMGRPTKSPGLYTQMFGRVLRKPEYMPNKMAKVLHVNFDDDQMRLVDHSSIVGHIPKKEADAVEEALAELSINGAADAAGVICNNCKKGYIERIKGSNTAMCPICKAITQVEMENGEMLFDPSKLNGIGSQARYIDMLHKQDVKWYLEDGIFSVGIGVGGDSRHMKADRTVLIVPPGRIPKINGSWAVVQVYKPVLHSEYIRQYKYGYWKHQFGEMAGGMIPAKDKNEAFEIADELVQKLKDPMLADKGKTWNKKPPSEGQIKYLNQFKVNTVGLKRGQASRILAYKFAMQYCMQKGLINNHIDQS